MLEFDFVVPSAQLSRAVKADEISVVEPTQPLRLARQSKTIERLGLLSQPLYFSKNYLDGENVPLTEKPLFCFQQLL